MKLFAVVPDDNKPRRIYFHDRIWAFLGYDFMKHTYHIRDDNGLEMHITYEGIEGYLQNIMPCPLHPLLNKDAVQINDYCWIVNGIHVNEYGQPFKPIENNGIKPLPLHPAFNKNAVQLNDKIWIVNGIEVDNQGRPFIPDQQYFQIENEANEPLYREEDLVPMDLDGSSSKKKWFSKLRRK